MIIYSGDPQHPYVVPTPSHSIPGQESPKLVLVIAPQDETKSEGEIILTSPNKPVVHNGYFVNTKNEADRRKDFVPSQQIFPKATNQPAVYDTFSYDTTEYVVDAPVPDTFTAPQPSQATTAYPEHVYQDDILYNTIPEDKSAVDEFTEKMSAGESTRTRFKY